MHTLPEPPRAREFTPENWGQRRGKTFGILGASSTLNFRDFHSHVGSQGEILPSRELTYPPKNGILKMIFLFPRWDMLIPWRVILELLPGGTFLLLFEHETFVVSHPEGQWMILVLVKGRRDYITSKRRHGLYLVYKWYCQVEDFFCYQAHPLHKNQKNPMISVGELSLFV